MCLENLCSWHKNKINMVLHVIGALLILWVGVVYNWKVTLVGVILMALGHLVQYLMMGKSQARAMPVMRARKKRR